MSDLRAAAFDYCRAGLSVFATAGKTPLAAWKKYQSRLPTEFELGAMPWERATGLGLALGRVSGGVCCRDFDTQASYESFAADNPWLAANCPTSSTARGRHIFFRATKPLRTVNLESGEVRGAGSYVILPPSRHASGIDYTWLAEPLNLIIESPTVDVQYFLRRENYVGIATAEKSYPLTASNPLSNLLSNPLSNPLSNLLSMSYVTPWAVTPTGYGQRNRLLFQIVRHLRVLPENQGRAPESFKPELTAWHAAALPHVRTKGFAVTLTDFIRAWELCRKPAGASMAAALATAHVAEPLIPDNPRLNHLAVLCRALADNPSREFFLSCRDACHHCGFETPMQALRAFQRLAAMGLIELVARGTQGVTGRANRYRFMKG